MFSDTDVAIYRTVHDFKGGPKALAKYLGVRPGTLSNKADPAMDSHHLNCAEAVAAMLASGDFQILHAMGREVGHACVQVVDCRGCSDIELLDAYAAYHKEIGDTAVAVRDALADGKITKEECLRVRKELFEEMEAGLAVLHRMEALIDER